MRTIGSVSLGLLWLICASAAAAAPAALRDGDLIFQTSTSSQSQAIQLATGSRWSHVGVVVYRQGKPYVLEAEGTVRYTELDRWVARGRGGHYTVRRLRDVRPLQSTVAEAGLQREARAMLGKPYDAAFAWSDQRMYCSELVWKLYKRAYGIELAPLSRLRDFRLDNPIVRSKLQERYHGKPPLDEPVIAPSALFDSPQLVTAVEE